MKTLLTLFFVIFCVFTINAQKLKTKVILQETYGLSYDKANDLFTICEKTTSLNKICSQTLLPNDNIFVFQEKLKETLDKSVSSFKFKIFDKDLLLSELKNIDFTKISFNLDPSKVSTVLQEVEFKLDNAPEGFPKFKIKNASSGVFELSAKDIIKPIKINYANDIVANKTNFITVIQSQIDSKKDELANYFEKKIRSKFTSLLAELYNTKISNNADYKFLTSESLTDTSSPPDNTYSFYYLFNNKSINIKVCKVSDDSSCKIYGPYSLEISENEFVNSIIKQHGVFIDGNDNNQTTIGKIYYMLITKKQNLKTEALKQEINDSITNIFEKIENAKNTFSGQFVINRKVPLYKSKLLKKRWYWLDKYGKLEINENVELLIDSVNIRFFNNRADDITIVGRLSNDKENTRVFTNRNYSLPLREFTHRVQTNSLIDKDNDTLTYYYDDILDFLPYKKYNYAVKNGEMKIGLGDSTKVVERKIGDYFTGIFFSDFLGLNNNNSNGLIIAEGRIRIPWHLRNYRKATLFDNITAYASVNLFSGFENNSRKVELEDTFDADETSEVNAENFTTDNFNLLSNNNIDAGVLITPYTFEWKGASTFIHLRYGLRFLRTGIEYNLKERDTIVSNNVPTIEEKVLERKSFQVFSIGQELEINFEIRPQSSVGADMTVGLNWFRANGTNKNDVDFSTTNNSPNLKVMANIYALTNSEDSNSGVYFRLGGHYNLGTYKVFPQIMVGYATNLSSFVNKLKKED
ncbi:hypothetical protein [uncultured Algibacter sp.]|uniref:hypothetical protein n=1 Tax=uncultured Algibacter sp. TaxID=298659 RepID=UPI00262F269D|nr:hypothetical protein [uncultured Algibacter sp.]